MNITFIHAIEAFVVLLVVIKLFQIRKLYIQSLSRKKYSTLNRKTSRQTYLSTRTQSVSRYQQNPAQKIFQEATSGFSRTNLPLPDVSFTEGLPLPEVSYVQDNDFSVANEKEYSKNKAALDSYINDMFFESSFEFEEDHKPFAFKKRGIKSHLDDEFITVAEENAQLVRDLQLFNQSVSFAR